jgi:hypothetical protein
MTQHDYSLVSCAFGTCLLAGLLLGARPGLAASCAAPDETAQCATLCSTPDECTACCAAMTPPTTDCGRACVHVRPPRPPRPARPGKPAIATTSATAAAGELSASCRLVQAGGRVEVELRVDNSTGVNLTSLMPASPTLQIEANAGFAVGVPKPAVYRTVRAGTPASFRWGGRFRAPGAVGISVSAFAQDDSGATMSTPLIDCGTAVYTQRPRPPRTRAGPHRPTVRGEAAQCAACHENPKMAFVAAKWSQSAHAHTYGVSEGNTFCAQCHSPLQADAGATATDNQAIPVEQWQGVTCSVCHPPEDKRAQWGTPLGLYDVATRTYTPLALADADLLCLNCHNGRNAPRFGDAGLRMMQRGVRCIDCHLARIASGDGNGGTAPAHDFKVVANLPASCGLVPGGCHAGGTQEWALEKIGSGAIHGNP